MIFGSHVILYSDGADADRRFLHDVLGLPSVDAGHGWLIFALPPAEAAVHPSMGDPGTGSAELFFMTDDLASEIEALRGKGVQCADVEEARWGSVTTLTMPSGATVGLYQPRHPSPLLPPP